MRTESDAWQLTPDALCFGLSNTKRCNDSVEESCSSSGREDGHKQYCIKNRGNDWVNKKENSHQLMIDDDDE